MVTTKKTNVNAECTTADITGAVQRAVFAGGIIAELDPPEELLSAEATQGPTRGEDLCERLF